MMNPTEKKPAVHHGKFTDLEPLLGSGDAYTGNAKEKQNKNICVVRPKQRLQEGSKAEGAAGHQNTTELSTNPRPVRTRKFYRVLRDLLSSVHPGESKVSNLTGCNNANRAHFSECRQVPSLVSRDKIGFLSQTSEIYRFLEDCVKGFCDKKYIDINSLIYRLPKECSESEGESSKESPEKANNRPDWARNYAPQLLWCRTGNNPPKLPAKLDEFSNEFIGFLKHIGVASYCKGGPREGFMRGKWEEEIEKLGLFYLKLIEAGVSPEFYLTKIEQPNIDHYKEIGQLPPLVHIMADFKLNTRAIEWAVRSCIK